MKNYIKNFFSSLKFAYSASPKYFILKAIINFINSFLSIAYTFIFSVIILYIELQKKDHMLLLLYFVLLTIIFIIQKILPNIQSYIESRYYDSTCFYLEKMMINKMKNIEQICYEESSLKDKIRLIRSKFSSIFQIGWTTINLITSIISIIFVYTIIIKFSVSVLVILIFITAISGVISKWVVIKNEKYEEEIQLPSRKMVYYKGLYEDRITNYEVRMFQNELFFNKKIEEHRNQIYINQKKSNKVSNISNSIISIMNIIVYLIVLIISINKYNNGYITIALISYYIGIIKTFQNYNENFTICINDFIYQNTNIAIVNEFFNNKTIYENNTGIEPRNKNLKIEFIDVWFKYPRSDNYVLKNCSFCIEPTEKVFLIGKNGSGKSTILKLLFGFYKPIKGKILIDEIEIEKYNINEVRRKFGTLFQDFIMYSLPFREIVSLSNFSKVKDNEEIHDSCEKSGIQKLVNTWNNGYDTILGIYYGSNGTFMSGGQWQLTSLARTYFTHSNYYILDEPSAALDIFSEDKIFREFYSDNTITALTISHMIANSIQADKIIVLEDGKIVECGKHQDLLKNDHLYSKWYISQLNRYIKS